ncbi:alpha/beta hydrolase [Lacicoccus alkaliphilus]|uniref:Phospholipase/carboxylesterase n=1 Tax=Lacicoccus alkaliphilus DSM 16010 TaxID=1123231 RepID=A0A1M7IZD0_9BACL|nr:alpha/beta hydrolase [Salinicoccus alkaliphilus]SHM46003.1 phospholipase/carboxylesterase [Salinicoccus alkaliphilus DSM 16010]
MLHIFKEGKKGAPVFAVLHGTGGTEHDLIPLAEMLNEEYSLLSIRGNVQEGGMNRYFKRHGEGQYDLEDLEFRGKELLDFIEESAEKYDFKTEDVIPIGFSNGSNIAINMILREECDFRKALLFAPLYPVDLSDNNKDLSGFEVFLSLGKGDPIVPEEESEKVVEIFKSRGAAVKHSWVNGHSLPQEVALEARDWLNQ